MGNGFKQIPTSEVLNAITTHKATMKMLNA